MKKIAFFGFIFLMFVLIGCTKDNPVETSSNTDIPADPTNLTVPTPVKNNIQPTAAITPSTEIPKRILVNLTGLLDPSTGLPITLTYNSSNPGASNIFLSEDGKVKGIKVSKVGTGTQLKADICFIIDNSGSMSEEADSIAAGVIKFAAYLQQSGLDAKFSIVGQQGPINGGVNFTDAASLNSYLQRSGHTGTDRTIDFAGTDSASLVSKASSFNSAAGGGYTENSVRACAFADTFYSWRTGVQKVFITFTDEGTQPGGVKYNTAYSNAKFSGKATIHTVFSIPNAHWTGTVPDTTREWENGVAWSASYERPWKMSEGTGGTIKFIHSTSYDLNLTNLPVSGALANSYLVEFVGTISSTQHTVILTIVTSTADGKKEYLVTY